jgi:hypothetical protein
MTFLACAVVAAAGFGATFLIPETKSQKLQTQFHIPEDMEEMHRI